MDFFKGKMAFAQQQDSQSGPLCFTAREAGSTVELTKSGSPAAVDVYTSTDGENWTAYEPGTTGAITLASIGDKVYFKNTASTFSSGSSAYYYFAMTGSIAASGNVNSMINYGELTEYCYKRMFSGCTSLTSAPALPATTLALRCYYYMFSGCTSLTAAPALPAETLANYCYSYMLQGCTSLTAAPALPAETLANYCYSYMFQGCTSLTTAPALLATTLAEYCCQYMFQGCTSLTAAPALPAETLANYCYYYMFSGCTSLTSAPALPATTLVPRCYERMFQGCTSLASAPALPATTLALRCYYYMFSGCTSLTAAPALPAETLIVLCYTGMFDSCSNLSSMQVSFTAWNDSSEGSTASWLYGVSATGTFKCSALLSTTTRGTSTIPSGWTVEPDALCFTANEAGSTVKIVKSGSPSSVTLYKSTDGCTWSSYSVGTEITLTNVGDKVYFKNTKSTFSTAGDAYYYFEMTGSIAASGNINSMINYGELTEYCYCNMFYNCTSLTSAPTLPATTLASSCYYYMFSGCTSLTAAPALPAKTLASYCYQYMFSGCTSLTTAPALPAETLAISCYYGMFKDCAGLTAAPALPAETLVTWCYEYMFQGCTSLTSAPALPATTLVGGCYSYMFYNCTSLTTVPALPAETLADGCCKYMFAGCIGLTAAPALSADKLKGSCYSHMFSGCTGLTTAPALPATTLASYCYYGMFKDCTSLTSAPALPATTLASSCYSYMFSGCSSLTTATELPSETLVDGCYQYMFFGCTSLTSAPTLPAETLVSECYKYMFYGCTNLSSVQVPFTDWNTSGGSTTNWLSGVATTGTFMCPAELIIPSRSATYVPSGWSIGSGDLCFTAVTALSTVQLTYTGSPGAVGIYTSTDGENWTAYTPGTSTSTIALYDIGDKVYFKNTYSSLSDDDDNYYYFKLTGSIAASGNINSMIAYTGLYEYCYYGLFYNCNGLTSAPALPATKLATCCYDHMFYGCTGLAAAPTLAANKMVNGCYAYMFSGCTSLTAAPALPATTLVGSCYAGMFEGCAKLTTAPELPATPATTGAPGCYNNMFKNCSKLSRVRVALTSFLDAKYQALTTDWLYGVAEIGYFNCPWDLTIPSTRGSSNVPAKWYITHYAYLTVLYGGDSVPSGAKWIINGSSYYEFGETAAISEDDEYTITFSTVVGYTSPASITGVTGKSGKTTTITSGEYVQTNVQLTVKYASNYIVPPGAQWTADGGTTYNSFGTSQALAIGSEVTVRFKEVAGYTAPTIQIVQLNDDTTVTAGNYTPTGTGKLKVEGAGTTGVDGTYTLTSGTHLTTSAVYKYTYTPESGESTDYTLSWYYHTIGSEGSHCWAICYATASGDERCMYFTGFSPTAGDMNKLFSTWYTGGFGTTPAPTITDVTAETTE